MNIRIFANAAHVMSGGDKIYMEYAKRWKQWGNTIVVTTNEVGRAQSIDHGLFPSDIVLWSSSWFDRLGVLISSIVKTIEPIFRSILDQSRSDILFSASFIWPDLLPGLIMKLKHPKSTWVVAWYLFIPNPFSPSYFGNRANGLIMYAMQAISFFIVRHMADAVFTASIVDVPKFTATKRLENRVLAVRGGLDYDFFVRGHRYQKRFDAVFVGRFHPQKNVDELLDIWREVIVRRPMAALALVGDGYLYKKLKKKVEKEGLAGSVVFLGIQDGKEKRGILKASRIFVSASHFDSGNMALDEALASGIPGVIYGLSHLDYPQGVVFIPVGDTKAFVEAILMLLTDKTTRQTLGTAGQKEAVSWDWEIKANSAFYFLKTFRGV